MTWASLANFAGEFFAGLGGAGVAGLVLKSWFDRRLGHKLNVELEKFRSELVKDTDNHRIISELQKSERNRAHKVINEFMDNASSAMKNAERGLLGLKEFDKVDAERFLSGLRATQSAISREEPYLSLSIPVIFEDLFNDTMHRVDVALSNKDHTPEIYRSRIKSVFSGIQKDFDDRRLRFIYALRETL